MFRGRWLLLVVILLLMVGAAVSGGPAGAGGQPELDVDTRWQHVPVEPSADTSAGELPAIATETGILAWLRNWGQPTLSAIALGLLALLLTPRTRLQRLRERFRQGTRARCTLESARQEPPVILAAYSARGGVGLPPPSAGTPNDADVSYLADQYGITPAAVHQELSPDEIEFVASYHQWHQGNTDVGGTIDLPRQDPAGYARFLTLAYRLQGQERTPAQLQEEVALRTGKVFPLWDLAALQAGTLKEPLSPLDVDPAAYFGPDPEDAEREARLIASVLLGLSPAGSVYDGYTAATGYDLVTRERLVWWERLLVSLGIVPFIPGGTLHRAVRNLLLAERQGSAALKAARRTEAIAAVRRVAPHLDEPAARHVVEFTLWADRHFGRQATRRIRDITAVGGGELVDHWFSRLDLPQALRMVEHYSDNRHLLGAIGEARAHGWIGDLVRNGDALILHFNEAVNQPGADLIWVDLKNRRVVFADVKTSVSGTSVAHSTTLEQQMEKNVDRAIDLINDSKALSDWEKGQLLLALRHREFDVQVILAGDARESLRLNDNLLQAVRQRYPNAQVRPTDHMDK